MTDELFTYDRDAVGIEVDAGAMHVTREAIAAYCEAVGDTNPLWTDDAWAARGPYGGVIAPPAFLATLPVRPMLDAQLCFGNVTFVAGRRFELYEPVRPGDDIAAREQILQPYAKTGRTGTMVFEVRRLTYLNQAGRAVAMIDTPTVHRQTAAVAQSEPVPLDETEATDLPSGQGRLDDIAIGDEFRGVWGVTKEQVAAYQVLGRTTPAGHASNYFLDGAAASERGLHRPIAQGTLGAAVALRLVTDHIGPHGWVRTFDASYRRPVMHGDRLAVVALMTDIAGTVLHFDLHLENERGERPLQAAVQVEMRATGG